MTTQSNLPGLITRLRTACAPESPLGKLFSEAANALGAAWQDAPASAVPVAWLIETFADDGKECLNSQFTVIPSVVAQFNKSYHRVTPLFAAPVAQAIPAPITYPAEYDLLPDLRRIADTMDGRDHHLLKSAILEIIELRELAAAPMPKAEGEQV